MFDIDKLFLSTIFYKKHDTKDQSGNILSRSVNTSWKEGTEQYYANKLIFDQIAMLKDSKSFNNLETRSMHYGDASIDSDTKLLTDIVDDIEIISDESIDPYDTYSLWRNTQIRDQFITGKFGIGPFALNNNNHILTMLYGVKFKETPGSILNITGHESLCGHDDMYGESIMSWLSGLINAHVDVAKDPYISKLNVNKYTYNLVNLMVRTGFGKMTFYFTTQPIMKELALRVNNAASAYGSNVSKSKYRRQADAENDFILEFANNWLAKLENTDKFNTVSDALDVFENSRLKKLGTNRSDLFESIFNNKSDLLRQIAKSGKNYNDADAKFAVETKHGTVELTMQDVQMLVYDAKLEFDMYSEALSQLVKYCKIDTKKQGKNISEQRDFMRGYNKLFNNPKSRIRKMFDNKSLQNLKYGSYIDTKTSLAISLFEDILSAQLIDATPEFNRQCDFVSRYLPAEEDGDVSKDVVKKISDAILVKIRSGFFNKYAERHGIDIKGLVNGNNTIYDRLNKLKIDIATKEEYEDLRDGEGNIYNYLLNTLTSGFIHEQIETQDEKDGIVAKPQKDTYDNVKFLSTMTFMDDDSIDADEMSESWEELLEDTDHPELQQFARDLIVYAFITNGGNGGSNNIYKYIPTSWLVNPDNTGYSNSFAYYMSNELDAYRSGDIIFDKKDADEVILNNWTDNQFIPTVKISDGFQVYYTGRASIDIINGVQVRPQTDIPLLMRCNINTETSSFVKIQRAHDKESQRSVAIYKKIGIVGDIATYVLVDPKGQNFGNKNKIYEYGRNDSAENEVSRQLGFNESLTMLAQQLGADITDVNDVINKLSQFVLSSTNREGSIELIKKYGVKDVLFDTVMDMVDNDTAIDQTEQTGSVNEALEELKNLNNNDRTYKVPETEQQPVLQTNEEENRLLEMQDIKDKAIADGTFMKAPNGNPTNLNERQWLQVRTKAFKNWFGDWMHFDKANPYSSKISVSNVEPDYDSADATGPGAMFLIFEGDNYIGSIAIDATYKGKNQFKTWEEKGNNYVSMPSVGDAVEIEKEFRGKGYGKAAYFEFAKQVANMGYILRSAPARSRTEDTTRVWKSLERDGYARQVGDRYEFINSSLNNASKVVDENGEPLVVYHSDDAEKFDSSRQYSWFSSKRQTYYGNRQYHVFLNVRNLFKRDNPTMEEMAMITDYGTGNEYDKLPKEYDGGMVYHKTFGYYELLTTRNSNQIKSATDNNGTFSTENDDIFDQLRALGQELINKCEQ